MNYAAEYEAGRAAGALEEREWLRQVALQYLQGGPNSLKPGRHVVVNKLMERLFGVRWKE